MALISAYIILITISYEQWIQSCQISTTKNFWENVKVFWGKRTNNQEGLARDPAKFVLEHSSRAIEQAPYLLAIQEKTADLLCKIINISML